MGRFASQGEGDELLLEDLDTGFYGVNNSLAPGYLRTGATFRDVNDGLLAPGLLTDSINGRCSAGPASTRPGAIELRDLNPSWRSGVLGTGEWREPGGIHWHVSVEPKRVTFSAQGTTPVAVPVQGAPIGGMPQVVAAFGRVVLVVPGETPLIWDGDFSSLSRGFRRADDAAVVASQEGGEDFTSPAPASQAGAFMGGRMFLAFGDSLAVSQLLDIALYDLAFDLFRANQGDEGSIVALHAFRGGRLVVLKEAATHLFTGMGGDLSGAALDRSNGEVGCIARDSVRQVGGDLLWLGQGAVWRLSEVQEDSMQTQEVPVSEAISAYMEQINWTYAHLASATVDSRYYRLAVPLGSSRRNNAVLVFDTVSRQWQGLDVFGALPSAVRDLGTAPAPALPLPPAVFSVGNPGSQGGPSTGGGTGGDVAFSPDFLDSGRAWGRKVTVATDRAGRTLVLDQCSACWDHVAGRQQAVQTRLRTRGYAYGQAGTNRVTSARLMLQTMGCDLDATMLTDGPGERETLVRSFRPRRDRRRLWGNSRYDTANPGGNFDEPEREDYTWVAGDGTSIAGGLKYSLHQSTEIGVPSRTKGRWGMVEVVSREGSVEIHAVATDAKSERNQLTNIS